MIDVSRGLEPLREAEAAIAKLQEYQSTAELSVAVQATFAAVQRSLRYLLRADRDAPDDLRLVALSPSELSSEQLIPALRQRNLISLQLAGQIHELEQASQRAERGDSRAVDADRAARVVEQLRSEIQGLGERPMRDVAHSAVETRALNEVHAVPMAAPARSPAVLAVTAVGIIALLIAAWLIFVRKSPTEQGIALYQRGDYQRAEQTLRGVVDADAGDAQAAFYLAMLYRQSERSVDAGRVLQRAIEKNPSDVYLREELGNLFMSLDHPELAAKHYRIAQEQEPDKARYWIKLVTALRAAGDPEAELVLRQAPPDARAVLSTSQ